MGNQQNTMVTQVQVPAVPGWDGKVHPATACPVSLLMQGGFMKTTCNIQPIMDSTVQYGASGYRLTAVFLPVWQTGDRKGRPVDSSSAGFASLNARAMLLFQSDIHEPAVPIETLWLQAPLTITAGFGGQSASGYEGIYGQLQAASQQGYSLSVMVDAPDVRCNGLFSSQTIVNLVCQRRQGIPSIKEYLIFEVPVQIQVGFGGQHAAMPTLLSVLEHHCGQGYRVASVYNPPSIRQSGFASQQTSCHIVFEKSPVQYAMTVLDVPFKGNAGIGSTTVDHSQYINVIGQYAQAGWELAGIIDMPDLQSGFASFTSTIKCIFQGKQGAGQGIAQAPVAVQIGGAAPQTSLGALQTDAPVSSTSRRSLGSQGDAPVSSISNRSLGSQGGVGGIVMEVTAPEGTVAGNIIEIQHPNTGAMFQTTIPAGVLAGQTFKMLMPVG